MKNIKYLKGKMWDKTKTYPDHLKLRSLSWPVIGLICDLPITANQVTVVSLLMSLFGGYLIIVLHGYWRLLGIAVMYFGVVLDFVDGGIARYKNHSSKGGVFLDSLGHSFIPSLIFVLVGEAARRTTGNFIYLVFGLFAGLFFLATVDFSFKREKFGVGKESHIKKEEGWRKLLGLPTYYLVELIAVFILFDKLHWLITFYAFYVGLRCLAFGYVCFKSLEKLSD